MILGSCGDYLKKGVTTICYIAFIWQLYAVAKEWLVPTHSSQAMEEKNLEDFDFPVIFKICPNPGFNLSALNKEGYKLIQHYFSGQSMYNSSLYGWAGHYNKSRQRSAVKGELGC